ncbi:Linear gramicidin synthase subunit D [Grifola frondosa]|uniref:Linear gramicidin synthase subunit D n=1 Tax=Grifola frondosa TaxID=5627 RepID=A0A1C7MCK6_GRIFR|nr:Linear gramicidin synthase subunit D [Grifola frondosa]
MYEEIQSTVTHVIHNAWHVNFNLTLPSFEPLVAGVRNLINFSLSSPRRTTPSILFVSSISVLQNQPSSPSPIPERPVKSVAYAVGTGYGEGKWVAEQVLLRAPSVPTTIVRVGQLCGDTVHGGWGEKEWVPSMLERSLALGAIPMRDEVIDWIPVDIAARTLLEMACSTAVQNECARILHVVHPYPIPWRTFSDHASQILSLPSIPYTEWVTGLKQQVALREYPLMEFFEQYRSTMISTECAVKVSKTLKAAKKIEKEDVQKSNQSQPSAHLLRLYMLKELIFVGFQYSQ